MRTIAYDYMADSYRDNGLNLEACVERDWYALRNFHMQYYEDSHILNDYLHYWRDTLASYKQTLAEDTPFGMKLVGFLARRFPTFRASVEKSAYSANEKLAENHRNSPRYWYTHRNDMRISAFFKSYEEYEAIGAWCPKCAATWNCDEQAKKNPFFAQVWYADHSPDENNLYPDDCINDIKDADRDYAALNR